MRSGALRHKITFQTIGTTTNDFGEIEQGNYQDFKTVWSSITPISGKETFLANKDFATVTHKIKIRFIPSLNASMQIDYMGRKFKIMNIRNFGEMGKELEILAEEQIND